MIKNASFDLPYYTFLRNLSILPALGRTGAHGLGQGRGLTRKCMATKKQLALHLSLSLLPARLAGLLLDRLSAFRRIILRSNLPIEQGSQAPCPV